MAFSKRSYVQYIALSDQWEAARYQETTWRKRRGLKTERCGCRHLEARHLPPASLSVLLPPDMQNWDGTYFTGLL
jgi:hypothetical protein